MVRLINWIITSTEEGADVTDELDPKTRALVLETGSGDLRPTIELLREVPEEEVWLQGQRSEQTRRAYKADIRHFIEALGVRGRDELRRVDRAAVIHWQRAMEAEGARPRTIRRRLSALSSLFTHLVSRLAWQSPPQLGQAGPPAECLEKCEAVLGKRLAGRLENGLIRVRKNRAPSSAKLVHSDSSPPLGLLLSGRRVAVRMPFDHDHVRVVQQPVHRR